MIVKSVRREHPSPAGTVTAVLALTRCLVPESESGPFLAAAEAALAALAARPGFHWGRVARSLDDPGRWVLASEWSAVGDYRRGLSAYDVKVALAAVMPYVDNEPGAYDVLHHRDAT